MKKKVSQKTMIIFCLIMLAEGFSVGQFVRIPAFEEFDIINAIRRPPGQHYRR